MPVPDLEQAEATQPGDVVDAHVHLFTLPLLREFVETNPQAPARFREALKSGKFGKRNESLPDLSAQEAACWYVERLRAADVRRAIVVSVIPDSAYTRDFVTAAKGHVHALCALDPRDPQAPALLEREMAAGFSGVKLMPVNRCYHLSDPACRPFLEKAEELGANIIIHYGISVDPTADLRYADPTDLSPVARDHPGITFVVAHFGAGYFEQVLQLGYARQNVCVDSSGTNNWMDFMAAEMTLPQVFRRAVNALGAERVLFGTDSNTIAPYRTWIRFQQQRILEEIGLSASERDLILRANAVRIFNLDAEKGVAR